MRADSPHPAPSGSSPIQAAMQGLIAGRTGLWLQQIIDNTPAVIYVKDLEGRFLIINRRFEELFQVSKATVLGKRDHDLFTSELADEFRRNDDYVAGSGKTLRVEESAPLADGVHTYLSTKFPLRDAHGQIYAIAGISTDITDRIELMRVEQELKTAREIQSHLYPTTSPEVPGLDIAGAAFPALEGCGDYYDFIPLRNNRLGIAVGDVSGHGLGPALQMVETRAYLRAILEREQTPETALVQLNRMLESDLPRGAFVSMFLCFIDLERRMLMYAGAGHDGFLLRAEGNASRLMSTGLVLGLPESSRLRGSAPWTLHSGDHLILSTDGIIETLSPAGEFFGWTRVLDMVRACREQSATDIVHQVYEASERFADSRTRTDDATLVVVKVL